VPGHVNIKSTELAAGAQSTNPVLDTPASDWAHGRRSLGRSGSEITAVPILSLLLIPSFPLLHLQDDQLIGVGHVAIRSAMLDKLIDLTFQQIIRHYPETLKNELDKLSSPKRIKVAFLGSTRPNARIAGASPAQSRGGRPTHQKT
jgi:hypothetical protein